MKPDPEGSRALVERIKELDCLYGISRLFSQGSLKLDRLLQEIVQIIPSAWQFPDSTCARISHRGREYRSGNYSPGSTSLTERIVSRKRESGFVEVAFLAGTAREGAEYTAMAERARQLAEDSQHVLQRYLNRLA